MLRANPMLAGASEFGQSVDVLQGVGYSLLGWTIVAIALAAAAGVLLGLARRAYQAGLAAAAIAYLWSVGAAVAMNALFHDRVAQVTVVIIGPAIEEIVRICFAFLVLGSLPKGARTWPTALAFAFGYALLESVVKMWDQIIQVSSADSLGLTRIAISLGTPFIVLLLHVFLSLAAFLLAVRGWRGLAVFAVTFVLHTVHNASVVWAPQPANIEILLFSLLARASIFGVLIWLSLAGLSTRRNRDAGGREAEAQAK